MDPVKQIQDCGLALADAVKREMDLENRRHTVKLGAIDRIMKSGDNPLTGKAHSYSSAEALVTTDQQYAEYLDEIANAVRVKIIAKAQYDAALAAARLVAEVAA
jgi:hypothetical protein